MADSIEQQLAEGKPVGEITLTSSLDNLIRKYNVRNIEPIFKNFKAHRKRIENLLKKAEAFLTKKEKHLVRRLKRAPEGAKVPDLGRIYKLELEPGQSAVQATAEYNTDIDVEYAQLNYVYSSGATEPNDPNYYPEQWALNNTGQEYPIPGGKTESGKDDSDIDAPEAWDITTGDSNVVVAVIDSGVDYGHRDLKNNIWLNVDEQPGDGNGDGRPGVKDVDDDGDGLIDEDSQGREPNDPNYTNDLVNDDDENGYNDDFRGWNFAYDNNDPNDDYGHGTLCAGVIAAEGNNGIDITGVCWNASIMALKYSDYEGAGDTSDIILAIEYAVNNGADILSNSWYGPYSDKFLQEAFDYVESQGVLSVACAGNNGVHVMFPACYDSVVAVSATDSSDKKAGFSCYGVPLDVAAPGVHILSLRAAGTDMYKDGRHLYPYEDPDATMYIASGTSLSCPHVAGVAALCLSVDPNLTLEEIRGLIRNSCDDVKDPNNLHDDNHFGDGRINAHNAVCRIGNDPCKATSPFPVNEANKISINVDLSWTPGLGTFTHDLYFGTDFNDVNDANNSSAEFLGNQVGRIVDQNPLDANTTYYWRVDEKNNKGTTKGDVWTFTTGSDKGIIYVDDDAEPNGDGSSWSNAFNNLQDALDADFWSGDEIWVAEGTYKRDSNGLRSGFWPRTKARIYGGFDGTESSRDARDPNLSANITILSGDVGEPNDPNDNSYHVVWGSDYLILDRVTITSGDANGSCCPAWCYGAGLFTFSTGVKMSNCTFSDNTATNAGAGIYNLWELTVTNCTFKNNSCTDGNGGGIYSERNSITVSNSTFTGNSVTGGGGGAIIWSMSDAKVTNCMFSGNTCDKDGGAICQFMGTGTITNCTLTENSADNGGGICNFWGDVKLTNCILWDNVANTYNEIYNFASDPNISNCDIEDCYDSNSVWDTNLGTDGGGNIDEDPCFVDPNNNDYHLDTNSPCIDAGDPNGDYTGQTDIDGDIRVIDIAYKGDGIVDVDMGADEYSCWLFDCFGCGDSNGDCLISDIDLSALQDAFPPNPYNPCADFNRDGFITSTDLMILLNHWPPNEACPEEDGCGPCTPLP